jgi:hypothetical protein
MAKMAVTNKMGTISKKLSPSWWANVVTIMSGLSKVLRSNLKPDAKISVILVIK